MTTWGPTALPLESERVHLQPLAARHLDDLVVAAAAPEIWRYLPFAPLTTRAAVEAWFAAAQRDEAAGASVPFAIIDKHSGRAVGSTRYLDIRRADRGLEIGATWLGVAAQRTPINTHCKYLLLCHAFDGLGALRVQLKTDNRNEASKRAIARIGASFEGLLRCERLNWDGHIRDSAYFSVVHSEWPRVKAQLERMLARSA